MRIAVCGSVAVFSAFLAVPALAQPPAAPPGPPPPGAAPPQYGPPPPGYAPPPGYPPPGVYYPQAPPANQERTAFNSLYVELLGPALFYSFNYDRIFSDVSVRIGIGYFSISGASTSTGDSAKVSWLMLPFDVNYIGIGSKKHIFEVGGGGTVLSVGAGASTFGVEANESKVFFFGHLNLGYRLQPPQGGFMLRTGVSPLIGQGIGFFPWPYIGLGATF